MRSEFLHTFLGIKFWILAHGIITHVFYEPLVNPLTNGVFFLFSPPDSFFFSDCFGYFDLKTPQILHKKKEEKSTGVNGSTGTYRLHLPNFRIYLPKTT